MIEFHFKIQTKYLQEHKLETKSSNCASNAQHSVPKYILTYMPTIHTTKMKALKQINRQVPKKALKKPITYFSIEFIDIQTLF